MQARQQAVVRAGWRELEGGTKSDCGGAQHVVGGADLYGVKTGEGGHQQVDQLGHRLLRQRAHLQNKGHKH